MTSTADSKWAEVHKYPAGPGDARPTAMAIIEDEKLTNAWSDKVVLITGASNGIGVEIARALYSTGAHLFLPVRDIDKGEKVADDIRRSLPDSKGRLHVLQVDLESLQSVRDCAAAFLAASSKLNVLICNAGVMTPPEGVTKDGFETQFGTNHLAHFLLFQLLRPALLAASSPAFQSRVVMLSSSSHSYSSVLFGDYNLKQRGYHPAIAYGQSKTANIYTANEIDRRYGSQGLHALSAMPGGVKSGLHKHVPAKMMEELLKNDKYAKIFKSSEQGAATPVWAATARVWEGRGGRYVEDCREAEPAKAAEGVHSEGYASWVYDPGEGGKAVGAVTGDGRHAGRGVAAGGGA